MSTPNPNAQADQGRSLKTKLGYGLGNVAVMVGKQAPKQLSLPIYNVTLGVNAGYVGTVLALGRVVDTFTDPYVGYLSDGLTTRWGRWRPSNPRKPPRSFDAKPNLRASVLVTSRGSALPNQVLIMLAAVSARVRCQSGTG
jgi:hypothetical protein